MPSSLLALAPTVLVMADEVPHARILEIGPGCGKYGLLCREYLRPVPERIDAMEAEPRYRELFPWVEHVYDAVFDADAANPDYAGLFGPGESVDAGVPQGPDEGYDLVIMVDVLEHLTHEDGEALLARIPCRVIVLTPAAFFQNPEADEGWETERHRSVWTAAEVAAIRPLEVHDIDALRNYGGVLVRTAPLEV